MTSETQWTERTAQQLVRYEALFKLLDEIQTLDDIKAIARRTATQWKYFANVAGWRLVVSNGEGFKIIDGFRGEARVADEEALSYWDMHHWELKQPCLVRMHEPWQGPPPPEHLAGKAVSEIGVLPFLRKQRCIGVLSAAARHEPFNDLDNKFIRIFGRYLADRISDNLLRKQATDALVSRATNDALTGLLNRGAIIERLSGQLALSKRTGQPLSVILGDIDFFKAVNDRFGHLAGDDVLREVSRRLREMTRRGDILGRYGGEEFLIVLFPCGPQDALVAAERFRRAIEEAPVVIDADPTRQVSVTLSLGTASTYAQNDAMIIDLLRMADLALYRSKSGGRNQVSQGGDRDR